MKYTKKDYAGIANALTLAKIQFKKDTYRQGLCNALDEVNHPYSQDAKAVVMSRLEGSVFLEGWLYHQGISSKDMTDTNMYNYRLLWFDMLIKEFNKYTRET